MDRLVRLKWATPDGDRLIAHMARVSNPKALPGDPSKRLIEYLIRNHHWSPFEMVNMCVEINTERDISAQILRHRSFTFQEFSTRYAEVETLRTGSECRFQDNENRQNSLLRNDRESNVTAAVFEGIFATTRASALRNYHELLRRGVAKEVARRILPIGLIPTKLYMNGTVRSWIHYLSERTKPGVQKEHREVALAAQGIFISEFPDTAAALGFFKGHEPVGEGQ